MPFEQNPQNFQKEKPILVHFREGHNSHVSVECRFEDKISEIIERYRNLSSNNDETNKFIFNAKALNPSLTVAEAGLNNNSNIFVVETNGIRGG